MAEKFSVLSEATGLEVDGTETEFPQGDIQLPLFGTQVMVSQHPDDGDWFVLRPRTSREHQEFQIRLETKALPLLRVAIDSALNNSIQRPKRH